MLDASTLHDALRAEGLVPPEEDVHLLACSNRWHGALQRIGERFESEQRRLDEDEIDGLVRQRTRDLLDDTQDAERRAAHLEVERDRALERAVELEAELARVKVAE